MARELILLVAWWESFGRKIERRRERLSYRSLIASCLTRQTSLSHTPHFPLLKKARMQSTFHPDKSGFCQISTGSEALEILSSHLVSHSSLCSNHQINEKDNSYSHLLEAESILVPFDDHQ